MKKTLMIIFMVLLLTFCACSVNDDEEMPNDVDIIGNEENSTYPFSDINLHILNLDENEKIEKIIILMDSHILLTSSGNLYSWGYNTDGALGLGLPEETFIDTPQKLDIAEHISNIFGSTNGNVIIAITENGEIYGWGSNLYSIFPGSERIVAIPQKIDTEFKVTAVDVAFNSFTLMDSNNKMISMGTIDSGPIYFPEMREDLNNSFTEIIFFENTEILQFANVETYQVFLSADGKIYVKGSLCAENDSFAFDEITEIVFPEKIVKFIALFDSIVALGEDGKLYLYGFDTYGIACETENDDRYFSSPTLIDKNIGSISEIWSSRTAVIVKNTNNEFYIWGYNTGNLCSDENSNQMIYVPQKLNIPSDTVDVFLGAFSCIVKTSGDELYAWGSNYKRTLLDPAYETAFAPVRIY